MTLSAYMNNLKPETVGVSCNVRVHLISQSVGLRGGIPDGYLGPVGRIWSSILRFYFIFSRGLESHGKTLH